MDNVKLLLSMNKQSQCSICGTITDSNWSESNIIDNKNGVLKGVSRTLRRKMGWRLRSGKKSRQERVTIKR
jgi:hypothetical protein